MGRVATPDLFGNPQDNSGRARFPSAGPEGQNRVVITVKPSTSRRIAWSVGLFSVALTVGVLVILWLDRAAAFPPDSLVWSFPGVLNEVVNMAVPVTGILIATRRPENPLGWLFLIAGLAIGLGDFGSAYSQHVLLADPGSLPFGDFWAWLSNWLWAVPIAALMLLLLLFPNGKPLSRRWGIMVRAVIVLGALLAIDAMVIASAGWSDPFADAPGNLALKVGFLAAAALIPIGMVASFVSAALRFRRSRGEERLQMKWFVTAAATVALTFSLSVWVSGPVANVVSSLALLFLWSSIAIAILKYRLYEIDVVINRAVVYGTLAVFITLVYVGLVVGIGTLVGNNQSPLLSAAAAAIVALAFQPVRVRAQRLANRVVYGNRATPYEVLSEFAERIAGAYASEDVLPRMASIVAAGTGADRAVVWLRVGNTLLPEASSNGIPAAATVTLDGDNLPVIDDAEVAVPVRHQGELLGAISVRMPPKESLSSAGERLVEDVASQAGLVLSNARLIEELRASRQRLVAAQDAERRKLERNLHDGAQQQLVALAVKQRLAATLVVKDPGAAAQMLGALQQETTDALENLRDLARGIYPPLLADQGLASALAAQARKAAVPVQVRADGIGRYPQDAEAAVYFCCLEALQNVAKYAACDGVVVRLSTSGSALTFEVTDDGRGFDPDRTPLGSGMQNMADRLAALGGALDVRSSLGAGTTVTGTLPAVELAAT
jgi:signal transduction histidine kinase